MTDSLRDRLQVALGGAYAIGRELGGGAMSRVFAATETALGREVVIKVLPPSFVEGDTAERFRREILLGARLRHPHILPIYAAGEAAGYLYYTMPFVVGEPLRDRLERKGPMSVSMATRIMREMSSALAYAHRNGVVHRDVKPENIFLEEEGTDRALLADFGVARLLETKSELTVAGTAIGTPLYMSPEQIDGGPIDGRTDVYSLGVVGWEMLAGKRPWAGETLYTIIYNQKYQTLPPLNHLRTDIPRRLQRAIERALAKDRDLRWPNAEAFAAALAEAPRTTPPGSASVILGDPSESHGSPDVRRPGTALVLRPRRRRRLAGVAMLAMLAVLVGAAVRAAVGRAGDRAEAPLGHSTAQDGARRNGEPVNAPGAAAMPQRSPSVGTSAAARGDPLRSQVAGGEAPRSGGRPPPVGGNGRRNAGSSSRPSQVAGVTARRGTVFADRPVSGATALLGQRSGNAGGSMVTHTDSLARCNSPRPTDQEICLTALTSDDDAQMARTLDRLVATLRQRASARAGDPDPPVVRQLRAEQVSWLEARAAACERESPGRSNPRWAPYRAWCMSTVAAGRADSLSAELRRLAAND